MYDPLLIYLGYPILSLEHPVHVIEKILKNDRCFVDWFCLFIFEYGKSMISRLLPPEARKSLNEIFQYLRWKKKFLLNCTRQYTEHCPVHRVSGGWMEMKDKFTVVKFWILMWPIHYFTEIIFGTVQVLRFNKWFLAQFTIALICFILKAVKFTGVTLSPL